MSMIKCGECGADVSSKAENCPNCGVRVAAKEAGCFTSFLVIGGVLFVIFLIVGRPKTDRDYEETCTPPPPETVQQWDGALEQMSKSGMVSTWRQEMVGTIPIVRATVGSSFMRSSVQDKQILAVLLWDRHFECVNEDGIVMFDDPRTGKVIAKYTPTIGFGME